MIDDDPFGSPLKKPVMTLDLLSIDELEAKIIAARAEIEACEAMIAAKLRQRSVADDIFKRPDSSTGA